MSHDCHGKPESGNSQGSVEADAPSVSLRSWTCSDLFLFIWARLAFCIGSPCLWLRSHFNGPSFATLAKASASPFRKNHYLISHSAFTGSSAFEAPAPVVPGMKRKRMEPQGLASSKIQRLQLNQNIYHHREPPSIDNFAFSNLMKKMAAKYEFKDVDRERQVLVALTLGSRWS